MKKRIVKVKAHQKNLLSWRMMWYSVFIWFLAILIGGFILLPWFYLVLPLTIFWLTIVYFKKLKVDLRMGLKVSMFWFFTAVALDFLEIIGPYYFNVALYFSDFRNWLKYPLVLLIPVIYSLIAENKHLQQTRQISTVHTVSKIFQEIQSAQPSLPESPILPQPS